MTSFDANFDRQKLMYHPERVAEWMQRGVTSGPLYTEFELCSFCNCRCVFCGVDYIVGVSHEEIDVAAAKRVLGELARLGNRAVMFAGHGESLLHSRAGEIIAHGSGLMSTSVTTNGITLDEAGVELIDGLEWIRFSVNAGSPESYARVHGVSPKLFDRALHNIELAVRRKRERDLDVTVGVQLVLIDENADSVMDLGVRVKDIGVDYFSVKPYSQHPLGKKQRTVDYDRLGEIEKPVRALADSSFRVIYRAGSVAKVGREKPYKECYGTHFLCFISADGDVWECNVFAGDPRFRIGNVREEELAAIWTGRRRKEVLDFLHKDMEIASCRDVCRMDECNRYLWRLKHPWAHDDFI